MKHFGINFGSHRVVLDDLTSCDPNFVIYFDIFELVWVVNLLAPGAKDVGSTFSPVSTFGAFMKPGGLTLKLAGRCWLVKIEIVHGVYSTKAGKPILLRFDTLFLGVERLYGVLGRYVAVEVLTKVLEGDTRPRISRSNASSGLEVVL